MNTTSISSFDSLKNQFLIAMPQLVDPYFANSVTYLWRHDEQGALGIVINKPLNVRMADIFNELDIHCSSRRKTIQQQHVLAGGPVEQDKGFIIHDAGQQWESSIEVTDDIWLCTSKQILQDIAQGSGPGNYLVALGYAGWEANQLENELSRNAWLTTPADTELLFSRDYARKADAAAALLGIEMHQLSPRAGHS